LPPPKKYTCFDAFVPFPRCVVFVIFVPFAAFVALVFFVVFAPFAITAPW
jgi:hypothetical protein